MSCKLVFIFGLIIAVSFSMVIPEKDLEEESFKVEPHIFESKIIEALYKLREFLKKGDPENGVPALDPYFVSSFDYDFFIKDTALKGFFENTTFSNFSNFEIENVELKLIPIHFKIDILLKEILVNGKYKMLGHILTEIPVNGTGKFISETKNLSLSLYIKPTTINSSLQVQDLLLEFKTMTQKINYTNEFESNKFQVLDENLIFFILDEVQEKYMPDLLNTGKLVLNHFLLGLTEKIPYLKETGIDAVWISPIYSSPMADFGYYLSNYADIHEWYGSMKDFDKLVKVIHDSGVYYFQYQPYCIIFILFVLVLFGLS